MRQPGIPGEQIQVDTEPCLLCRPGLALIKQWPCREASVRISISTPESVETGLAAFGHD